MDALAPVEKQIKNGMYLNFFATYLQNDLIENKKMNSIFFFGWQIKRK